MPHHGEKHHEESSLILTGFVSYRFHLRQRQQPSKSGASPSRKRARRVGQPGDLHSDANDDPFLADPDASIVGFVLHNEARSEDYLLSAPQHLQRLLAQAAAGHLRVQVSADFVVDVGRPSTALHDEEKAGGARGFVETSNVQILSTDNVSDFEDGPRTFLSLAQVRRAEAVDNVIGATTKRWDVKATVRAVSPILTADPADPYCLVELLDADALCTGVAILRQKALVHHASIVPDQTLFLRRARRRAWNVHETLPPAADAPPQLPSKVLLVDQPDQIVWPSSASPPAPVGDAFRDHTDGEACPISVSGEVARIRTVRVRKDDKSPITEHLHTIELVGSAADPSTSHHRTLFVTYFPLPTSHLLSIRQGARILATNVRPMPLAGSNCYCATLRSHLSLLSHGPRSPGAAARRFTATDIAIATHPCRPPPARLSYEELWARRAVAPLVDPWLTPPVNNGALPCPSRPKCPDPKEVAEAYLRSTGATLDKQRMSGAAQRDTNAEFFFGDCEGFHPSPFRHGDASDGPAPCASHGGVPAVRIPMNVDDVYSAAIQALYDILDGHLKSVSCSFGCMGSIHRTGMDLVTNGDSQSVGHTARPVVFGLASSANNSAELLQVVLSSPGVVSIPCALRLPMKSTHGKFVLATVESFIASFLCLGVCEPSSTPHPIGEYHLHSPGANSDSFGTCQILVVRDVVFLVSLRLECTNGFVFDSDHCLKSWDNTKDRTALLPDSLSIQECLADRPPSEPKFFFGLLASNLLRVSKATNGSYKGCTLSLAHLPSDMQDVRVDRVSTVQSSDLKLSIPVDDSMLFQLRRRLASTARLGLLDRQLVVACIWWQIALQAQLLLDGGWDELVSCGSALAESTGVVVKAPISAVQLDPARGYVRLSCQLRDLTLSSIQLRPCLLSSSVRGARHTVPSIDFLGKKRILPGDLSSRAKRRLGSPAQYLFGELYHPVSKFAGIPCCTIADLFRDLVADLASKSRSRVAPSLVREIRSAKLLTVSYCQVIAECPSCFKSLVASSVATGLGGSASGNGGTSLKCPGQCPSGGYASVKWECSGTLDDGTGQAKLYAEREAALALLGMTVTGVRIVEAAARSRPGGLVYSRGLPPRPDLVVALDAARHRSLQKLHDEWSMERQQHPRRAPRARITEGDLLNCLSAYDRGDLVLQRHCRCSREPTRDLVYYVRCKPVSDEVLQRGILGLSDIDVLRPGVGGGRATVSKHVATYALPPLKLVLVDVASPSPSFHGDSEGA